MLKTSLNRFFGQFSKSSQIAKSPKQNIGQQMVQKVAQRRQIAKSGSTAELDSNSASLNSAARKFWAKVAKFMLKSN